MPRDIQRAEVRRLRSGGAQLVEVLPAEEFKEDHLPGAISIPLRGDVSERAAARGWGAAVVVNEERVVLGLLRKKELAGEAGQPVERAMRPGPSTFRPYAAMAEMAAFMVGHNLDSSPITTSDGRLVGLLFKEDVVRVAHELQLAHEQEDKAL